MNRKLALKLLAFAVAGLVLIIAAAAEGLSYSPDKNPGATGTAAFLGVAGLACWAVPAVTVIALILREARQQIRDSGLTPVQAALLEAAAMEGAHLLWSAHNRRVNAELSASVMGDQDWHPTFGEGSGS